MRKALFILLFGFIPGGPALADHPNEGTIPLEKLVEEALAQNQEIRAFNLRMEAANKDVSAARGAYFPEISIEGGPLKTKFNDEGNSGTAAYGKAEWNLYRGGLDNAAIGIKALEAELSKKQFNLAKSRVEREVARLYYEMLFLFEGAALKEKALQMNQEQMNLAKIKNRSGFTSSADVIEFELSEATIKSDLKRLVQEKAEKSRELSVLLGRSEPNSDLLVAGHLSKESLRTDGKKVLTNLERENQDLIEADIERQIAEKEKSIARSGFLPRLNFESRYGKIANEERVFSGKNNYSIFLRLNIPLFSGLSTKNDVGAAGARLVQKEAVYTQKALTARAEADNLVSQIDSILERLALEEKTLRRSEDYYKITLAEYRRGVKNSPDMVGAAERLLDAKIRNLEYRRDHHLAILKLRGLAGLGLQAN